jgi:hypothetical protein
MVDAFKALFDKLNSDFLKYFIALASLGAVSMSIVQAIKSLVPVRQFFQKRRTHWWLKSHICEAKSNLKKVVTLDDAEKEVIMIAAAGNPRAFYNSEPDDFFKQLTVVGRLVLNYPTNQGRYISYGDLLSVFASNVTKADFSILDGTHTKATPQERLDARNRVQQQLIQGINAFEMSSTWWWQNGLHLAAFLCSTGLAYLAFWKTWGIQSNIVVLLTALLAAFLAPVARDLVAAIEKLRS